MLKNSQVELLAPAGSYESMTAAFMAGADAVYIGGSRFGARAYADNPDEKMLLKAIDYAHLHGKRLYMTVNTLVKEEELGQLYEFLLPYYKAGVDAVIVQDMGVFMYIREHFPELPLHVSTQMTITGAYGAKLLRALGAERVVTARELSLREIRRIHEECDIEIESFVHGALCYCYSGQCLFSSLVGGRSGNRGRCAQPCRLPYDVKKDGRTVTKGDSRYVLSLKDLCALDLLPDLIEAGVCSMKIEGRMKSPRYTAGVVSIYRKYLDLYLKKGRDGYRVQEPDKGLLLDLFDRGGFTEGYSRQHNGKDMIALKEKPSFREGNQALFDYLDRTYVKALKQEAVEGIIFLEQGRPALLKLSMRGITVQAEGPMPQAARNQPMTEEKVRGQLMKTGNTPFVFQKLDVRLRGDLFLPLQALNELRRTGLELLEEAVLKTFRRDVQKEKCLSEPGPEPVSCRPTGVSLSVLIEEPRLLNAVLKEPDVRLIYIDAAGFTAESWWEAVSACHKVGKSCFLAFPHIFRKEAREYFHGNLDTFRQAGFDGVLLRSLEEIGFLEEQGISMFQVFDYSVYSMNHLAAQTMRRLGAGRLTLPVELNSRELEKLSLGEELIIYGHIPMMVTAQCIQRTMEGCRKTPVTMWLRDRLGKEFPVKNHCRFCYNTIYNSSPISLLGNEAAVRRLEPSVLRLQFTVESPKEAEEIIHAFAGSFLRGETAKNEFRDFTRGHFKRGIE